VKGQHQLTVFDEGIWYSETFSLTDYNFRRGSAASSSATKPRPDIRRQRGGHPDRVRRWQRRATAVSTPPARGSPATPPRTTVSRRRRHPFRRRRLVPGQRQQRLPFSGGGGRRLQRRPPQPTLYREGTYPTTEAMTCRVTPSRRSRTAPTCGTARRLARRPASTQSPAPRMATAASPLPPTAPPSGAGPPPPATPAPRATAPSAGPRTTAAAPRPMTRRVSRSEPSRSRPPRLRTSAAPRVTRFTAGQYINGNFTFDTVLGDQGSEGTYVRHDEALHTWTGLTTGTFDQTNIRGRTASSGDDVNSDGDDRFGATTFSTPSGPGHGRWLQRGHGHERRHLPVRHRRAGELHAGHERRTILERSPRRQLRQRQPQPDQPDGGPDQHGHLCQ
jgi:hypothetical protein